MYNLLGVLYVVFSVLMSGVGGCYPLCTLLYSFILIHTPLHLIASYSTLSYLIISYLIE